MKRMKLFTAACLCCTLLLGCGAEESKNEEFVQMVNPLVTVNSVQEMEQMLGYTVPVLDKDVASYIVLVIDGSAESGRIRYADGTDFNIKRGSGDISGIYGGTREGETSIGGVPVSLWVYEDLRYALWEADGFTHSLAGTALSEADLAALIGK